MTTNDQGGAAVRFPPPLVFLAGIAVSAGAQQFLPLSFGLASWLWWIVSCSALAFGLLFILLSGDRFRRSGQDPQPWKPTPSIIDTGIYGWSRNPMYIGMAAIELGIGVWIDTMWILLAVPISLALVYYIAVGPEEDYLREKFGEEYERYINKVRRWI